jgi:polyhydroxyalkanoate synthesis regulator phasin
MTQAAKKIAYPTEAHAKADELLKAIKEDREKLEALNSKYLERANELASIFKVSIQQKKADLELLEKRLKKLCKANREKFFEERDRVDL